MKKFILCFITTVCIIAASEIDMHGKSMSGATLLTSSQFSAAKNKILVQNFWNAVFNEHKISVIDKIIDEKYIPIHTSKMAEVRLKMELVAFSKNFQTAAHRSSISAQMAIWSSSTTISS